LNHHSPNLNKDPWLEIEDKILIGEHSIRGNAWKIISSYLQGRTPNAVKNRCNWLRKRKPSLFFDNKETVSSNEIKINEMSFFRFEEDFIKENKDEFSNFDFNG
jgi:hypothetical protein